MALTALRYDVEKFAVSIVGRCERAIFPLLAKILAGNEHMEPFRQCLAVFSDEMEAWKREAQESLRAMLTSKVEQVGLQGVGNSVTKSASSEPRLRERYPAAVQMDQKGYTNCTLGLS